MQTAIKTYRDLGEAIEMRGFRRGAVAKAIGMHAQVLSLILVTDPDGSPSKEMVDRVFTGIKALADGKVDAR